MAGILSPEEFEALHRDFQSCQVWYWDPCNGMGGRAESRGFFRHRVNAEAWIAERLAADKSGWEKDSYSIREIEFEDD